MQSLHTSFHHTVGRRNAARHHSHALRIHAAELHLMALHNIAFLHHPDIRLACILEDGMGRNGQTAHRGIASHFHIDIHIHTGAEPSLKGIPHSEELVGISLGQHAGLMQSITHAIHHAVGFCGTVQQAIHLGRNVHLHLHAARIDEIHHRQPRIDHLRRLEIHLLDGAIDRSRQTRVAQLVLGVLQLDA